MDKRIKLLIACLISISLLIGGAVPSYAEEMNVKSYEDAPKVSGTSAILIDGSTGEILYEKNAYERRDPASVTKMLNALVVLDTLNLDEEVIISDPLEPLGHVLGLQQGEAMSVKNLLYGMLIYSANDAAEALGYAAGGDLKNFCDMMNAKAKECGAKETTFTNACGMNNPGQENHKTTAYDLAMIAKEAMKNKTFRKVVSTTSYEIPATNKSGPRKVKTTNACLSKKPLKMDGYSLDFTYKGCTGIKTGETSTAGECIVCSAKRGNTELIAVVLNAPTKAGKFKDVTNMLDYGFKHFETYTAQKASEFNSQLKVKQGNLAEVELGIHGDFNITIDKKAGIGNVKIEEKLDRNKVEAPIEKGTVLGKLVATDQQGNILGTKDIVAMEEVKVGGPLSKIGIADEEIPKFLILTSLGILLLLILLVLLRIRAVNRRRRRARRRRMEQRRKNVRY